MNYTKTSVHTVAIYFGALLLAVGIVASMSPLSANAATYAYVDNFGDVRSVTANDWMTAIDIAPNRYAHSGVLLLTSALDYGIVGDHVNSR